MPCPCLLGCEVCERKLDLCSSGAVEIPWSCPRFRGLGRSGGKMCCDLREPGAPRSSCRVVGFISLRHGLLDRTAV